MNKIYKVIWLKVKNAYVVASELAKSRTKSPKSGVISSSVVAGILAAVISCGAVMPMDAEAYTYNNQTATVNELQADADTTTITNNSNITVNGNVVLPKGGVSYNPTYVGSYYYNPNDQSAFWGHIDSYSFKTAHDAVDYWVNTQGCRLYKGNGSDFTEDLSIVVEDKNKVYSLANGEIGMEVYYSTEHNGWVNGNCSNDYIENNGGFEFQQDSEPTLITYISGNTSSPHLSVTSNSKLNVVGGSGGSTYTVSGTDKYTIYIEHYYDVDEDTIEWSSPLFGSSNAVKSYMADKGFTVEHERWNEGTYDLITFVNSYGCR